MNRRIILLVLPALCLFAGCSSKLTNSQAKQKIDAALQAHPMDATDLKSYSVPGFGLPPDESKPLSVYFTLDDHKEYGGLSGAPGEKPPTSEDNLVDALSKLGYVTVQENGPKTVTYQGSALHYAHSRTVAFTPKAGAFTIAADQRVYAAGFACYPAPKFDQCNLPPLIQVNAAKYSVESIEQDGVHANAEIFIPWKLTDFGAALKPFAAAVEDAESKLPAGESQYTQIPDLYEWEHLLNDHVLTGASPATIQFQKLDDGWHIVDGNGKSI